MVATGVFVCAFSFSAHSSSENVQVCHVHVPYTSLVLCGTVIDSISRRCECIRVFEAHTRAVSISIENHAKYCSSSLMCRILINTLIIISFCSSAFGKQQTNRATHTHQTPQRDARSCCCSFYVRSGRKHLTLSVCLLTGTARPRSRRASTRKGYKINTHTHPAPTNARA